MKNKKPRTTLNRIDFNKKIPKMICYYLRLSNFLKIASLHIFHVYFQRIPILFSQWYSTQLNSSLCDSLIHSAVTWTTNEKCLFLLVTLWNELVWFDHFSNTRNLTSNSHRFCDLTPHVSVSVVVVIAVENTSTLSHFK